MIKWHRKKLQILYDTNNASTRKKQEKELKLPTSSMIYDVIINHIIVYHIIEVKKGNTHNLITSDKKYASIKNCKKTNIYTYILLRIQIYVHYT